MDNTVTMDVPPPYMMDIEESVQFFLQKIDCEPKDDIVESLGDEFDEGLLCETRETLLEAAQAKWQTEVGNKSIDLGLKLRRGPDKLKAICRDIYELYKYCADVDSSPFPRSVLNASTISAIETFVQKDTVNDGTDAVKTVASLGVSGLKEHYIMLVNKIKELEIAFAELKNQKVVVTCTVCKHECLLSNKANNEHAAAQIDVGLKPASCESDISIQKPSVVSSSDTNSPGSNNRKSSVKTATSPSNTVTKPATTNNCATLDAPPIMTTSNGSDCSTTVASIPVDPINFPPLVASEPKLIDSSTSPQARVPAIPPTKPQPDKEVKGIPKSSKPGVLTSGNSGRGTATTKKLCGVKNEPSRIVYLENISQGIDDSDETTKDLVLKYAHDLGLRINQIYVIHNKVSRNRVGCKIYVPSSMFNRAIDSDIWPDDVNSREWISRPRRQKQRPDGGYWVGDQEDRIPPRFRGRSTYGSSSNINRPRRDEHRNRDVKQYHEDDERRHNNDDFDNRRHFDDDYMYDERQNNDDHDDRQYYDENDYDERSNNYNKSDNHRKGDNNRGQFLQAVKRIRNKYHTEQYDAWNDRS
ncbi:unnamed protein product [Owenia fusiformis]|uniref:Uncharacterized protein n=1 Tax=Owenia fusiformis TaxID=6347 RepID=A0A8J1UY66_OWEFU|nr:unnamed protein product [Owenia fusiformis]